jgi:hypothetical protein
MTQILPILVCLLLTVFVCMLQLLDESYLIPSVLQLLLQSLLYRYYRTYNIDFIQQHRQCHQGSSLVFSLSSKNLAR